MRNFQDNDLLDLVGRIYDCALEPQGWSPVLEDIATGVGGIATALSIQDPLLNEARFSSTWGVTRDAMESYNSKYAALNPVLTSGWYCEIDEPISAARYAGEEAYFSSRFAREFLQPLGWGDGLGSHLMKLSSRYSILAIYRPWGSGVYSDGDLERIRALSPHVRRAVSISDVLSTKSLHEDELTAALNLMAVGIILVDGAGRIVHANNAAREHLDNRTALRRDGDRLSARDPSAAANLSDAVVVATTGDSFAMPACGIAVPMPSADGRDLAAWVLPLDGGQRRAWAAPTAAKVAVFVRELGDTSPFQGELFVKRYGITPAECRVLMMLVQGLNLVEACQSLGIAESTAKTHLARLFAKTGTSGQADLMRLAMSALSPARR